jgi:hypothetical protein
MKKYRLKEKVILRLEGLILILLAYAAHIVQADEAAILFVLIGAVMLLSNPQILTRFLYKISKRIYRRYRWTEIRGK